jgi:AraC-like DNA-binding protein
MQKHIFNIHDVILLMTVAECLLLLVFQTILPVKNRLANHLLNLFLFSLGISSACVLVLWNNDVQIQATFDLLILPYILIFAQLIKGPTLLLYVYALTQESFCLKVKHLIHAIPIVIALLWLSVFQIDSLDLRFITEFDSDLQRQATNLTWHFIKVIPVFYAFCAVYAIYRYRIGLKNQYSDFSTTEPNWLNILGIGILFTWCFSLAVHIIANTFTLGYPNLSDTFGVSENYVIFILINALFINSLIHTHQLLTTKSEPTKDKQDDKPTESSIQKVLLGMEIEKLFLKQNLNIDEFSRRINLPVKEVSAVINKHHGTNFFEFMNSYRVEEAKRLLSDPQHSQMNIMDVLLQAGFNSKSAFHRFFNRLVGISPTEFRKRQLDGK